MRNRIKIISCARWHVLARILALSRQKLCEFKVSWSIQQASQVYKVKYCLKKKEQKVVKIYI